MKYDKEWLIKEMKKMGWDLKSDAPLYDYKSKYLDFEYDCKGTDIFTHTITLDEQKGVECYCYLNKKHNKYTEHIKRFSTTNYSYLKPNILIVIGKYLEYEEW